MNRLLFIFILLSYAVAMPCLKAKAGYFVVDDSLAASHIYPGTVHSYQVAVPDSWDGRSPAALYVGLDGQLCNALAVIDSLTSVGAMPPTVAVFLQPGVVKDNMGRVVRYNRSNEFDATDSRFASFLAEELLPAVEGRQLPDGRVVRLTDNPGRRCIFGLSSGGIAAFTAAFHRPELFGLVFSGCGTFVPMRGGDGWPAVVRKHEPRNLKVFLQDGFSDTWNPVFGSWYEANRLLASALEYAGYDCAFDWAEGGHSVRRATEIFPQVMTWLWASPASPKVTGNTLVADKIVAGKDWEECSADHIPSPAPAMAVYPDSSLTVTPGEGGWLDQHILNPDGRKLYSQRFYWLHSFDHAPAAPMSMTFDREGWLWVLTDDGIQVCDHNGRVRAIFDVPAGVEAIAIADGYVYAYTPRCIYRRAMNVEACRSGERPKSQGQG